MIIALILILLFVSLWLFLSLQKTKADIDISASLSSPDRYYLKSNLVPSKPKRKLFAEKTPVWLRELLVRFYREYIPPKITVNEWASGCDGDGGAPPSEIQQRAVKYYGLANIPLKVYQGDSYNITLNLHPSIRAAINSEGKIRANRQGDDKLNITLSVSGTAKQHLEVEMVAAGFTVAGELKQKQSLLSDTLNYQWNCFFEKSGTHSFALVFRVVENPDFISHVGRIEQTIKVAQVDHLTQRQVWVLATIAGVLSGVLTLAEILKNLGVW